MKRSASLPWGRTGEGSRIAALQPVSQGDREGTTLEGGGDAWGPRSTGDVRPNGLALVRDIRSGVGKEVTTGGVSAQRTHSAGTAPDSKLAFP